jgi:phosphoglycolate phosphatase
MRALRALLFDLDGTLVQTRESSWVLFERIGRKHGLKSVSREGYYRLFQGNFYEALAKAIGDAELTRAVTADFLDVLTHEYRPLMVPGMTDVVRQLADRCVLAIISSNAVAVISRIVRDAGIETCIAHVFGGDVAPDKRVAIRSFLADPSYATIRACDAVYREEAPVGFAAEEVALVTDTTGDIAHAKECGIRTVAVTWGMHDRRSLDAALPDLIVDWPQEIVAYASGSASRYRAYIPDGLKPVG